MPFSPYFQICSILTCSNTLFYEHRHLNNSLTRALYYRRYITLRQRHRRAQRGEVISSLQRRRVLYTISIAAAATTISTLSTTQVSYYHSFQSAYLVPPHLHMAFEQQCRRRGSSIPSSSLGAVLAAAAEVRTATSTARSSLEGRQPDAEPASATMSSPLSPSESQTQDETRSARSTSSASRNSNRLSLTLPIAPPNSLPSRPIPTPSSASVPPTPIDTPAVASPTDRNEFIIAIAAQERRVLELKEELSQAERQLRRLQKQFTASEGHRKRTAHRNVDPLRTAPSEENQGVKRTSELERRKAILLAQSQGLNRDHKRTIIRGGHARTLSLLSPTTPTAGFPLPETNEVRRSIDGPVRPDWKPKPVTALNKRATWAPRQTQQVNGVGVKQIANDFKQGLWTFVEDLRQATVGDEAVSGNFNRTSDLSSKPNKINSNDQDTIRASTSSNGSNGSNRGRIPFPTDSNSESSTPVRSTGSFNDRLQQQQRAASTRTTEPTAPAAAITKTRKHFSWTPLTFDQFDDDDWSSWDSPTVKQSRWSGSTVNGDIVPAVPDRSEETEGIL